MALAEMSSLLLTSGVKIVSSRLSYMSGCWGGERERERERESECVCAYASCACASCTCMSKLYMYIYVYTMHTNSYMYKSYTFNCTIPLLLRLLRTVLLHHCTGRRRRERRG